MTSDAPATTSQKMKSRMPADSVERNARVLADRPPTRPRGRPRKMVPPATAPRRVVCHPLISKPPARGVRLA